MNLIVAIDRKGAIGRRGELLYHISADLRRFKALTTGHTVVMGRKTFE
ncbi:dihydrofolate reductase, partial [Salmonella enterica]